MIKKFILLSTFTFVFSCTVNTKSEKFDTIQSLREQYKNVSQSDKSDFYVSYLKVKQVADLKKDANFKHFSDNILNQLVNELYDSKPVTQNIEYDTISYNQTFARVENAMKNNEELNFEDLRSLYNPFTSSGMEVYDLEAKGNKITFTTSAGTKMGTYYHTYIVRGEKLVGKKVTQNEN